MIERLLTHPLFIASTVSFFLGSFGYILIRLWLGPIFRYVRIKNRIRTGLGYIETNHSEERLDSKRAGEFRSQADALNSVYYGDLPYWHRLFLQKKNEDPIQAASLLMKLSNTRNPIHARQQATEIKNFLNIKT